MYQVSTPHCTIPLDNDMQVAVDTPPGEMSGPHPRWLSGAPSVTVIVTIASFPGLNWEQGTLYSFPTSAGPLVLIIDFFVHEL